MVQRLVECRLVERRRSKDDGRRIEIRLDGAGRAFLQRDRRSRQMGLIRAIEGLSRATRRQLDASLRSLLQELGIGQEPATVLFEDGPRRRAKRGS